MEHKHLLDTIYRINGRQLMCVCVGERGLKCGEEEGNWKVWRVSPCLFATQRFFTCLIEVRMQRMLSGLNPFSQLLV